MVRLNQRRLPVEMRKLAAGGRLTVVELQQIARVFPPRAPGGKGEAAMNRDEAIAVGSLMSGPCSARRRRGALYKVLRTPAGQTGADDKAGQQQFTGLDRRDLDGVADLEGRLGDGPRLRWHGIRAGPGAEDDSAPSAPARRG